MYNLLFSVFIKVLLHNIGTHVDPIILIDKIKEGMKIEGLRDSLVKILQDYHLQVCVLAFTRMIFFGYLTDFSCEIINHGVLICHLNHANKNPTK